MNLVVGIGVCGVGCLYKKMRFRLYEFCFILLLLVLKYYNNLRFDLLDFIFLFN